MVWPSVFTIISVSVGFLAPRTRTSHTGETLCTKFLTWLAAPACLLLTDMQCFKMGYTKYGQKNHPKVIFYIRVLHALLIHAHCKRKLFGGSKLGGVDIKPNYADSEMRPVETPL
jgi:hypothetical protein